MCIFEHIKFGELCTIYHCYLFGRKIHILYYYFIVLCINTFYLTISRQTYGLYMDAMESGYFQKFNYN